MGRRGSGSVVGTAAVAVAAVVIGAAALGGCSGSGGSEGSSRSSTTTDLAPATAADVLDRIGCETVTDYRANWFFGEGVDPAWIRNCSIGGQFVARVAAFDNGVDVASAVFDYGRFGNPVSTGCNKWHGANWITFGPDWMAISTSEEASRRVVTATQGSYAPYTTTPGPPPSFVLPYDCPQDGTGG